MTVLALKMTDAGLEAITAASGTDPTVIAEIGLTATAFDYAPTLTELPGEFKRVAVLSGIAAAPNITHLTAYDTSAEVWTASGLGLYLEDGTLLGVVSSADPLIAKAAVAFALLVFDIAFEADLAASIVYGNATFVWPPATETMRGVAELATQARVDAEEDGEDDAETIVTPRTLRARLAGLMTSVAGMFAARSISGGGLVAGGGNLSADRTLTVAAASGAEALARELSTKAVPPLALIDFLDGEVVSDGANATCWRLTFGGTDYFLQIGKGSLANNSVETVDFPVPFTTKAYAVAAGNSTDTGTEGGCANSSNTLTGVTVVNNGAVLSNYTWWAFGW